MARATWWSCWPRWACCSTSPPAGGGCARCGPRHGREPTLVPTRIVIVAGGTAGHVVPALSVADELRAEGAEVAFIGGERAELELVPAAGYELHRVRAAGLDRRNPLRAARAVGLAAAGVGRAARLLRELRPDAVLGAGGYVAGPVGGAAGARRRAPGPPPGATPPGVAKPAPPPLPRQRPPP